MKYMNKTKYDLLSKETIKKYIIDEKNKLIEHIDTIPVSYALAIVQVGDNAASNRYIAGKLKDCAEIGIDTMHVKLSEEISENSFKRAIIDLNKSKFICGIIIQKPLPEHLEKCMSEIIELISPYKDVDGFRKDSYFSPCTPKGIVDYLMDNGVDLCGKHCVIIGRSELVGKPLAKMMTDRNATVTLCHSKTKDLSDITKMADILVVAIGKPLYINKDYINPNAIVIDVGINVDENGKLCGDVDYDSVKVKCVSCSQVPGGVGLLTRLALLKNTIKAMEHIVQYEWEF